MMQVVCLIVELSLSKRLIFTLGKFIIRWLLSDLGLSIMLDDDSIEIWLMSIGFGWTSLAYGVLHVVNGFCARRDVSLLDFLDKRLFAWGGALSMASAILSRCFWSANCRFRSYISRSRSSNKICKRYSSKTMSLFRRWICCEFGIAMGSSQERKLLSL